MSWTLPLDCHEILPHIDSSVQHCGGLTKGVGMLVGGGVEVRLLLVVRALVGGGGVLCVLGVFW